jgi:DNA polymerase-3 subunit epsilon
MLSERLLHEVPLSFIDFETTGLSAKSGARVVELAVVRLLPGGAPEIVLDTLVDPDGPVLCTSIHGISGDDVLGAPRFSELIGNLVRVLDGSLVGAFNASFDMSFLIAEARLARRTAVLRLPPHVCLMWLRPLIGLGKRCSLDVACRQHGLRAGSHRAAEDALACAYMWQNYLAAAEKCGIKTVGDLAQAGSHSYLASLQSLPYGDADFASIGGTLSTTALKPRQVPIVQPSQNSALPPQTTELGRDRVRAYWHALINAFSDGVISIDELEALTQLQRQLKLMTEEVRAAHARLFADRLREYAEDNAVSSTEASALVDLRSALRQLGWAPGT